MFPFISLFSQPVRPFCFLRLTFNAPPSSQRLMSALSYYLAGGNKVGAARSALHQKECEDAVQGRVAEGPTRGCETHAPRPASSMSMCL